MIVNGYRKGLVFALLSLALLTVGLGVSADDLDNNPVIIVNPDVSEPSISLVSLRTIFGMRLSHWGNGEPIHVFVLADDHPVHQRFSKQILGMFPYQLRWAWDRLVFSGTGQAPIQVNTEEEMKLKVSGTPGAIGYITGSKADDKVKIASIK
jgi:hypothetical protein